MGIIDLPKLLARTFAGFAIWLLSVAAATAQSDSLAAFENFVKKADFESANFYLQNGILKREQIDSGQIFYDATAQRYRGGLEKDLPILQRIYDYLAQINPVDLNRVFLCGYDHEKRCMIARDLLSGARPAQVAWFIERGLDLNKRVPEIPPATLPLLVRLGSYYSLTELNWFAQNGLVLGDETYPLQELSSYRDDYINYQDQLTIPGNYLNLADQNFLDVLVMVLGSNIGSRAAERSARRAVMCDFIAYAAPSYTPSFDYLGFILNAVEEFRGKNIGRQEKDSRTIYQPFPTSCVTLIESMAKSHARLDSVISSFASNADVETANWLISIVQPRQGQ